MQPGIDVATQAVQDKELGCVDWKVDSNIDSLRNEMASGFGSVRNEYGSVRSEIGGLRAEVNA